jgi:hypothetical protein
MVTQSKHAGGTSQKLVLGSGPTEDCVAVFSFLHLWVPVPTLVRSRPRFTLLLLTVLIVVLQTVRNTALWTPVRRVKWNFNTAIPNLQFRGTVRPVYAISRSIKGLAVQYELFFIAMHLALLNFRQWMEGSGLCHASATLTPGEKPSVPIARKTARLQSPSRRSSEEKYRFLQESNTDSSVIWPVASTHTTG